MRTPPRRARSLVAPSPPTPTVLELDTPTPVKSVRKPPLRMTPRHMTPARPSLSSNRSKQAPGKCSVAKQLMFARPRPRASPKAKAAPKPDGYWKSLVPISYQNVFLCSSKSSCRQVETSQGCAATLCQMPRVRSNARPGSWSLGKILKGASYFIYAWLAYCHSESIQYLTSMIQYDEARSSASCCSSMVTLTRSRVTWRDGISSCSKRRRLGGM